MSKEKSTTPEEMYKVLRWILKMDLKSLSEYLDTKEKIRMQSKKKKELSSLFLGALQLARWRDEEGEKYERVRGRN